MAGDIERLRLTLERELCHPHDAALVGGFGGVEEIGAGVADIDLGLEAVALERDRHAVGLAAARSRGHENGGRFAPKLKLEGGRRLEFSIGPAQRHHDAGRPAGEFGGLVKIRRRERGQVGDEPLLETQGIAAVLIVAAMASELLVAALAVARDRGVVGHVHFETDGAAATRDRGRFGGREQHRADPASSDMGCDRDGIETGDDRARPKQHDGAAGEPVAVPSHGQLRAGRL